MLKQAVGCEPPVSALASVKLTVLSSKREQQLEVIRNRLDLMRGFRRDAELGHPPPLSPSARPNLCVIFLSSLSRASVLSYVVSVNILLNMTFGIDEGRPRNFFRVFLQSEW